MSTLPPRILVALAVSVVAVVVLGVAWLVGTRSDPSDGATPTTTTTSAVATTVPTGDTIAPTPITVLPDWYRKSSSRYDERRPATTVPPDRTGSSTTAPTTTTSSVGTSGAGDD